MSLVLYHCNINRILKQSESCEFFVFPRAYKSFVYTILVEQSIMSKNVVQFLSH